MPAAQQHDSSSETEDSESENDDRSSASESDSSHSESDGGDDRTRTSDRSSDDSGDESVDSPHSASEDEVDETVEVVEEHALESTVEVRVHVHEAKELTPMDGSTSDPYAYVTCFGHSEKTKTASKGTDAIWDEELQFSGTVGELQGGVVSVAVWDEDFGADDLIGSFDFDLEDVRKRSYKEVRVHRLPLAGPCEQLLVLSSQVDLVWTARTFAQYYKTWITLFNPARDGAQGKVRVSITILETGDELPPRPGRECPEDTSQMEKFDLHVRCFCAEGLPQMDRMGLADPYVSLFWCGRKVRTSEVANTLSPEFYQEMTLPVHIEGNPEAPPSVDLVVVRVREYNRTGNVDIAYGSLYLSDIQRNAWKEPCWLNLYGGPRIYGDGALGAPTITGKGSIVLEQMNSGKKPGNTYRGRVLLSAELKNSISDSQTDGVSTAFVPELDYKPLRAGTDVVPRIYPAIPVGLYTLRVGLLVGCDLPVGPEVFVRVSWGVPKTGAAREIIESGSGTDQRTRSHAGASGVAIWNELLTLEVVWPLDRWQVPDVFVELVERKRKRRTHFLRIDVNNIDDVQDMVTGSADKPMLNGRWYNLVRSSTEQVDPEVEPRVLMCLGIECDEAIRRVARDVEPGMTRADADSWRNLRQIKPPCMRDKHNWTRNDNESATAYPKGGAPALRKLAVLRRSATAAGAKKAELKSARDSGLEKRMLLATLLEHLVGNGGHRQQAGHQFFGIRVHVYQARYLQLNDQRRSMPVLVARMWDALGTQAPIDKQTQPASEGSPQSPCWYQTLVFEHIKCPGTKAGDRGLRMASPLLLYVQQQSNPRWSAPALAGRLCVPIVNIRASFERPEWVALKSSEGKDVGELLVGFEMYAETQRIQRSIPRLRPRMTTVNLTVVLIGGRNLKDTNPTFGERFGSALVRTSKVEFRPGAEESRSTAKSDGSNPTYLHVETWHNMDVPRDELYAPSLSAQVFHDAGVMNTVLLGTAELNLAKHIQKFFVDSRQPRLASSGKIMPEPEPEPEPVEWTTRRHGVQPKSRKGTGYAQLESSDESERSESESTGYLDESDESEPEVESTADVQRLLKESDKGSSDRKSAKIASTTDNSLRPFFARRQGERWHRFASHKAAAEHLQMKPKEVAKCLSENYAMKGFEFKYAVEAEGVKNLDPAWRVGRRRALDELENCYPELLDTYDDLEIKGKDSHGNVVSAGTLKVWIGLWDPAIPGSHHPQAGKLSAVVEVTVRAYIVRAFRLTAKDAGNTSDPFVKATLNGRTGSWPRGHPKAGSQVEKVVVPKTLNPYFGQVYEWTRIKIPGTSALKVEVFDDDVIGEDLVGVTEVDIEERFLSQEWQDLGLGNDNIVRRPSECRDLFCKGHTVTQGSIEMWVEVFPASDAPRHPFVDISAPQKDLFELRVVIWDASDMISMDRIGDGLNDLFISAHLYYRDSQNRLHEAVHETDIHWRAQAGKGSFNYRLLFPDLELPMDDGAADSDLPRFVLRAWDQDVIGDKDLIGSAEVDIRDMFRAGWTRLQQQQGRDEEIGKMSDEELKQAISEMWDAEFEHVSKGKRTTAKTQKLEKIQKNRTKLPQMNRAKMRKILVESDPKRSLANTLVRLPDPHDPLQAAKNAGTFASAGCNRCCRDSADDLRAAATEVYHGMRTVLSARPSRDCCVNYLQCQCLPDLCRSLCAGLRYVCRATCTCRKCVTDKAVDVISADPVAAHKPLVVNVIGAHVLSDSSDDGDGTDEDATTDRLGGATWGSCGQLRISMELLPKALADERPAGRGREEPNQFPTLPEPVGRAQLSLNPYTMLVQLVGPTFASKMTALLLAVGCCLLLVIMVPLILSNIIAHITEHAMGV